MGHGGRYEMHNAQGTRRKAEGARHDAHGIRAAVAARLLNEALVQRRDCVAASATREFGCGRTSRDRSQVLPR
jgi:hypothetical protein